jgi:uncharacterized protein
MAANYRETVIDGYNLIHKLLKKESGDAMEKKRAQLELVLARYRQKTRRQVTVVYDGGRSPRPLTSKGALEVIFSGSVKSADHWIIDHVRALGPRADMTLVVSSDREIRRNAIAYGAKCLDSEIFIDELDALGLLAPTQEKLKSKEGTRRSQKEGATPVTDTEIDYWLRLFEPKK